MSDRGDANHNGLYKSMRTYSIYQNWGCRDIWRLKTNAIND